jgi:ectoine hydroxylase-related dioxygenase (phytanoyl-CoA dioxygenase family)
LVPGSHLAPANPDFGGDYDTIPAEMPKGSVLVWHGSLWHGGGANRTDERRVGVAMNYCAGYIRQQENQQLGIPPALVATFPKRLQQLVGYSIYQGLIGHIDKHDPRSLLERTGADSGPMIWDVT